MKSSAQATAAILAFLSLEFLGASLGASAHADEPTALFALKGETLGIEIRGASGVELPAGAHAFEIKTVETKIPSFKGARVGTYEDPVVPVSAITAGGNYWVDYPVARDAEPGIETVRIAGRDFTLTVVDAEIPTNPTVPLYMELQSRQTVIAHGLEENVVVQGPLTKKYVDLYREHRIEPIKQAITQYPTEDLDQWGQFGASWRQLVLDGAIAPPCLFGPDFWRDPDVNMLHRIATQVPNGWIYAWDEGEYNAYMTGLALARVQMLKREVPNTRLMITRQESPDFRPYIDEFTPVLDWFKQPGMMQDYTKTYGLYTSCMAQGNCKDQTAESAEGPTGTPMMVLDAPAVHTRAFPVMIYSMGASYGLYFNGTQNLPTAWAPGGLYNEGGNGDGTLVYPCGDGPCASLRMKHLRQGMNDVEWMVLAHAKGIAVESPVKSAFDWSKEVSDYDAIRSKVAAALVAASGNDVIAPSEIAPLVRE